MYRTFLKPFIDRMGALLLLLLTAPILILTALLIYLKMGRPIFFRQRRPGKGGEIFSIFKFRTMSDEKDANGHLLPDEVRLKGLGRWIRSTSIDELPQLINVLRGEMSFIGPRPLLEEYLPLYTPEQAQRHDVLPGITGWAQVNGRNTLNWQDRFRYDVEYVHKCSLGFDLKIIAMTIKKVLKREGVSAQNHVTVEKFTGNE